MFLKNIFPSENWNGFEKLKWRFEDGILREEEFGIEIPVGRVEYPQSFYYYNAIGTRRQLQLHFESSPLKYQILIFPCRGTVSPFEEMEAVKIIASVSAPKLDIIYQLFSSFHLLNYLKHTPPDFFPYYLSLSGEQLYIFPGLPSRVKAVVNSIKRVYPREFKKIRF